MEASPPPHQQIHCGEEWKGAGGCWRGEESIMSPTSSQASRGFCWRIVLKVQPSGFAVLSSTVQCVLQETHRTVLAPELHHWVEQQSTWSSNRQIYWSALTENRLRKRKSISFTPLQPPRSKWYACASAWSFPSGKGDLLLLHTEKSWPTDRQPSAFAREVHQLLYYCPCLLLFPYDRCVSHWTTFAESCCIIGCLYSALMPCPLSCDDRPQYFVLLYCISLSLQCLPVAGHIMCASSSFWPINMLICADGCLNPQRPTFWKLALGKLFCVLPSFLKLSFRRIC